MKSKYSIIEILNANVKDPNVVIQGQRIAEVLADSSIPRKHALSLVMFQSVLQKNIGKSDLLKILLLFSQMEQPLIKLHYAIYDNYGEVHDMEEEDIDLYFKDGKVVDRITGDIRNAFDKEVLIYFSKVA